MFMKLRERSLMHRLVFLDLKWVFGWMFDERRRESEGNGWIGDG